MKRRGCAARGLIGIILTAALPCLAAGCGSAAPDAPPYGAGGVNGSNRPLPAPPRSASYPNSDPTIDHDGDLPDPDMFSSGSSSFWRTLDDRAVHQYASANERRIMAVRLKDAAAADAALQDYERYFSLHRQYHQRYIQAEAIERMTALGVAIGTGMRP
jgi:hypothetical protein